MGGWPACEQAFADVTKNCPKSLDERGAAFVRGGGGRVPTAMAALARSPGSRECARSTIVRGVREIQEKIQVGSGRIRQAGGGS